MNKTTQKFIEQFKNASAKEREALIKYLKFDYKIQLEELKTHLSEEEYRELLNVNYKPFDLEEYIEMKLTDEFYELAYRFFKTKQGKKIIKDILKTVKQELREKQIPKPYHKREVDRIINLKITFKEIFSDVIPSFIEYLEENEIF